MGISTEPQAHYTNAVVLYHWTQCTYCVKLMPVWRAAVQHLPTSTQVYEIEVNEQRKTLLGLGVDLDDGVPRIVVYNNDGEEYVYSGPRTRDALVYGIRAHLITVHPRQIPKMVPATVLYFRNSCSYCTRFLPTYLRFASQKDAGTVVAVDTSTHREALQALDPPATSVPHVVHFDQTGKQTVFDGERTVFQLNQFLETIRHQQQVQQQKNVSFKGGGGGAEGVEDGVEGDTKSRLAPVLDRLQERAQTTLGELYGRAFEPDQADVCFIGMRTMDTPSDDVIYILMDPREPPKGKPKVMAAIYGSKNSGLSAKIYARGDKELSGLLRDKRLTGFHPVPETNSFVHTLREFGYHVDLA